jgi:hypothetical protein
MMLGIRFVDILRLLALVCWDWVRVLMGWLLGMGCCGLGRRLIELV